VLRHFALIRLLDLSGKTALPKRLSLDHRSAPWNSKISKPSSI
jgi:hypothetical protein